MKKLKVLLALGLCLVCLPKIESNAYTKSYQVYDPLWNLYHYNPRFDNGYEGVEGSSIFAQVPKGVHVISADGLGDWYYDENGYLIRNNDCEYNLTYDSLGNVIEENTNIFAVGRKYKTTYTYDSKGRITSEHIEESEYYEFGGRKIPAKTYNLSYVYDDVNMTIDILKDNKAYIKFNYKLNENGKLSSVSYDNENYTFTYSPEGYVVSMDYTNGNKNSIKKYTYDDKGNILTLSWDDTTSSYTYTYDSYGRVISDGYHTYIYY